MLLHAIGSASDSGGSASANSRRSTGARATRRMAPAPGRGGRTTQRRVRNLRHAAVCRLRNAPTDRPIEKRLRSVSSLLIVLSLTPTRISILAPGMGPGYIHSLSFDPPRSMFARREPWSSPQGAVLACRKNPKPGTSVLLTTATNTSPTLTSLVAWHRRPDRLSLPAHHCQRRFAGPCFRTAAVSAESEARTRRPRSPAREGHRRRDGPAQKDARGLRQAPQLTEHART